MVSLRASARDMRRLSARSQSAYVPKLERLRTLGKAQVIATVPGANRFTRECIERQGCRIHGIELLSSDYA
jgi:hypothetical protein